MPKLQSKLTDLFDMLDGFAVTAWGITKSFRGRPRKEQANIADPFVVYRVRKTTMARSAAKSNSMDVTVDIMPIFPYPTSAPESVLLWLVAKYDAMCELVEGVSVWPGGGTMSIVSEVDFDEEDLEGKIGMAMTLQIHYDCAPGT